MVVPVRVHYYPPKRRSSFKVLDFCHVCIDTSMLVVARLPQDDRWSWHGEHYPRGLLDHILISPGLLPFVETVHLAASSEASDHRECSAKWLLEYIGGSHRACQVYHCRCCGASHE